MAQNKKWKQYGIFVTKKIADKVKNDAISVFNHCNAKVKRIGTAKKRRWVVYIK